MSGGKKKLVHKTEKETMISMLVTMLEGVGSIYIMYMVYLRPPYCCTHVIKHWTHLEIHQPPHSSLRDDDVTSTFS